MKILGLISPSYPAVRNLYMLMTFPLTAWCALFALRRFGISYVSALVASVLYAFIPFHLWRALPHFFLSCYYLVPLGVMLALWVYLDQTPLFRPDERTGKVKPSFLNWRALACYGVCMLIASAGAYYAFFACFLLLVAGLAGSLSLKRFRPLAAACILVFATTVGFVANVYPSLIYIHENGVNPMMEGSHRDPAFAETYGLKIAQLLLPIGNHPIEALAELRCRYSAPPRPLINENETASLGLVGSIGFLLLLGRLLFRRPPATGGQPGDGLAILNLSALLLGTIGGFGALVALFGCQWIRGYNRISVYIGFVSLFAVALVLDRLLDRFGRSRKASIALHTLLALMLLAGLADQIGGRFDCDYRRQLAEEYQHDADFVQRIEESVPKESMIFQLPYAWFPSCPPLHKMGAYAHFRPYLHSRTLRWSYGGLLGREGDAWYRGVAALNPEAMVGALAEAGFQGIYLDRHGFADNGADLEAKLAGLLQTSPLVSANQRLVFFSMQKFNTLLRAGRLDVRESPG
jgi:phosphoglycerol transferase